MQHIYGGTQSNLTDNRWIEPEFLWYVTGVLLFQLKMKWAGPLFLFEVTSATPPLPPSDSPESFCWCSRPLPPSPIYSALPLWLKLNLLLLLQSSSRRGARVLLLLWWSSVTMSSVSALLSLFTPTTCMGTRSKAAPQGDSRTKAESWDLSQDPYFLKLSSEALVHSQKYVHLLP